MNVRYFGGGVALAIASALVAPAVSAADLVFSSTITNTQSTYVNGIGPYIAAVGTDPDAVKIEYFGGGTLANGAATLGAVSKGVADMGTITDIYTPSDLPISNVLSDMFVFGTDARIMTGAVNEVQNFDCPRCKDEWDSFGIRSWGSYSLSPYYLYCSKAVVTRKEDFAGLRVRATSGAGQLAAAAGAAAVNITLPETYEAMQRGAVDCVANSMAVLKTYSLWDHAKHVLMMPLGTYHGVSVFNLRKPQWDKLTEGQRQKLIDATPDGLTGIVRAYVEDHDAAVTEGKAKGLTFDQPAPELVAWLDDYRAAERDNVLERAASRNVDNPEELVSALEAAIAHWTEIVNGIGDVNQPWTDAQWAAYTDALAENIFSKVSVTE